MTNDELCDLLEGRHTEAAVRLAVMLPGLPPLDMALFGAVTEKSLRLPDADRMPGTVWLLSGAVTGLASPLWWLPRYRLRP